jgi:hypothetical protein
MVQFQMVQFQYACIRSGLSSHSVVSIPKRFDFARKDTKLFHSSNFFFLQKYVVIPHSHNPYPLIFAKKGKYMVPALIGAAVAIGTAIYGGVKSAKARKAQQKLIDEQRRRNEEWYNKNYYSDYLQTAETQSALSQLRDQIRLNNRQASGAIATRGGTDEARLAAQSAGNRTYADAIRGIAGQATAYKRGVDMQNQQNQQGILSMMMNMYNQNAANANQLAQNGMNAGVGLMQSSDWLSNLGKKTGATNTQTNTQTIAELMEDLGYQYNGKDTFKYTGR